MAADEISMIRGAQVIAPGLKWRKRSTGLVPYWIPPQRDVRAGYPVKSLPLNPLWTDEQRAARCRELWIQLEQWRAGKDKPAKHTIRWLVGRYQRDEFSPYRSLGEASRRSYDGFLRIIDKDVGHWTIGRVGASLCPCGEDFRRWHKGWGTPGTNGKPATPSRQRHLIVMLRALMSYAVEIGVPGAIETRAMLAAMRFPTTPPRETAPTREQVLAIVAKAKEIGWPSIAATTLAQYELIERRVHIIGKWEGHQWRPGWTWEAISPDWTVTYFQTKRGRVRREFNLATVQPLLQLLQLTPREARTGAVIRCEATGQPWREEYYARTFRKIARAAGVPDSVWSMDMRAGGATEADIIPGVSDRALQDAGGWTTTAMRDRYRKDKTRNAQNVVELRQKNRSGAGGERV